MKSLCASALLSLLLLGSLPALAGEPNDALAIIRKSVEVDQSSWEIAKDYAFVEEVKVVKLDGNGKRELDEWTKYDVTLLDGDVYRRLMEKNGKPLSPDEERKEQEKLEKSIQKQLKMSEQERAKRRRKAEEERRRARAFLKEVANAFHFTLLRQERYRNHDVWVIAAEPRPDYKPTLKRAELFKKIRGVVWIDKQTYQWVKAEAETIQPASFGLFLARLAPGATFGFEQDYINNEAWLMKSVRINFDAKLGLVKRFRREVDVAFGNYRKFTTDSRIVATRELE